VGGREGRIHQANIEYWEKELREKGIDCRERMLHDNGRRIITDDPIEPLYGSQYLPKKFKIAVRATRWTSTSTTLGWWWW